MYALIVFGITDQIKNRINHDDVMKVMGDLSMKKYHDVVAMERDDLMKILEGYSLVELKNYLSALIPYMYYGGDHQLLSDIQNTINMINFDLQEKVIDGIVKESNKIRKQNRVLKKELAEIKATNSDLQKELAGNKQTNSCLQKSLVEIKKDIVDAKDKTTYSPYRGAR